MSVQCTKCGYIFIGHENCCGKICTRCGEYLPPQTEMPIVKKIRMKHAKLLKQAMELIRKRNANLNRHDEV
jgi:predicted  nucleic acid-binding Zn-ribbon protein